jgi:ssDNA-binding Zn-finger/Zn-ribbon topoisomerase 1
MTKEQARQSELKKMELCEPCAGIQRNWRRAPGHAELVQRGNRKEERGNGTVTITIYKCDHCGTVWEYENDKANLHAGWSVVGR